MTTRRRRLASRHRLAGHAAHFITYVRLMPIAQGRASLCPYSDSTFF